MIVKYVKCAACGYNRWDLKRTHVDGVTYTCLHCGRQLLIGDFNVDHLKELADKLKNQ